MENDIVWLHDVRNIRNQSNLVRIEEAIPGPYGLSRVFRVRYQGKSILKPIGKIYHLECRDDTDFDRLQPIKEGENVLVLQKSRIKII